MYVKDTTTNYKDVVQCLNATCVNTGKTEQPKASFSYIKTLSTCIVSKALYRIQNKRFYSFENRFNITVTPLDPLHINAHRRRSLKKSLIIHFT